MLSLIAALTRGGRVIGAQNRLPWRLPEDLKRFRRLTTGHAVIMGRKTFESIGRPLPDRRNIVISRRAAGAPSVDAGARNAGYAPAGVEVAPSLETAVALAGAGEIFVIGGAEIYRLALPHADRLYLTWIEREVAGDAHFPEFAASEFREIENEAHWEGEPPYRFVTLERARNGTG